MSESTQHEKWERETDNNKREELEKNLSWKNKITMRPCPGLWIVVVRLMLLAFRFFFCKYNFKSVSVFTFFSKSSEERAYYKCMKIICLYNDVDDDDNDSHNKSFKGYFSD